MRPDPDSAAGLELALAASQACRETIIGSVNDMTAGGADVAGVFAVYVRHVADALLGRRLRSKVTDDERIDLAGAAAVLREDARRLNEIADELKGEAGNLIGMRPRGSA